MTRFIDDGRRTHCTALVQGLILMRTVILLLMNMLCEALQEFP
jgi:hypothetical protein